VAAKNLIDPVLGPAVRITIGVVSGTLKYYEPGDPSNEKTITASLLGKMGGIFEHQVNSLSAGQAHTEVLVEWA
jgi:LytS/YehU family sensor histidine kinase